MVEKLKCLLLIENISAVRDCIYNAWRRNCFMLRSQFMDETLNGNKTVYDKQLASIPSLKWIITRSKNARLGNTLNETNDTQQHLTCDGWRKASIYSRSQLVTLSVYFDRFLIYVHHKDWISNTSYFMDQS